jgi:hypothetical protein
MEKEQIRIGLLERNVRLPGRDEVLTRFCDGISARIENREPSGGAESDIVFVPVPDLDPEREEREELDAAVVPEPRPEPPEVPEWEAAPTPVPEYDDSPDQVLDQHATASFEATEALEDGLASELSQEYTSADLEPGTSGKKRGRRKKKGAQS